MNKRGFTGDLAAKNPLANAGDMGDTGSISGLEDSPGEENGDLLQYSCLENHMDRGAWLQSMGSQRVRHNLATKQRQQWINDHLNEWMTSSCDALKNIMEKTAGIEYWLALRFKHHLRTCILALFFVSLSWTSKQLQLLKPQFSHGTDVVCGIWVPPQRKDLLSPAVM